MSNDRDVEKTARDRESAGTEHCRCKHCGMPLDQPTLDGGCPHCADIYPHTEPHPNNATRCDGCGHQRAEVNCDTVMADDGTHLGTYCYGCQQIMENGTVEPGEHEQYTLMEGSP